MTGARAYGANAILSNASGILEYMLHVLLSISGDVIQFSLGIA